MQIKYVLMFYMPIYYYSELKSLIVFNIFFIVIIINNLNVDQTKKKLLKNVFVISEFELLIYYLIIKYYVNTVIFKTNHLMQLF